MSRVYSGHQATRSWKWWVNILIIHLVVAVQSIHADELSEGPQDLHHDPRVYAQQLSAQQQQQQRQSDPKRSVPIPISTNITRTSPSTKLPYPLQYFWTKEEYPNPLKEPFSCQQPKSSLLCDPDRFLDRNEADEIRKLLDKSKQSKKCFCPKCPAGEYGLKIGVAVAGNIYRDTNDASQEFADELLRKWNYALCNDSILLLLIRSYSQTQSSLTVSMGNVAEKVFPADFFHNLIPKQALSAENYGKFLQSILAAIIDHVESIEDTARFINLEDETPTVKMSNDEAVSSTTSTTSLMVISIIIGFIAFIAFLVGAMVMMKRKFSTEPDPELPKNDVNDSYMNTPLGYESVSQNDGAEDNNNHDGHEEENENESRVPEPQSSTATKDDVVLNEDSLINSSDESNSAANQNDTNNDQSNNDSFRHKDTPV